MEQEITNDLLLVWFSNFDWEDEVRRVVREQKTYKKTYRQIAVEMDTNNCYLSEVLSGKRRVPYYWLKAVVDLYLAPTKKQLSYPKKKLRDRRHTLNG